MAELNTKNQSFIYENETDAQLAYADFLSKLPIRCVKRK